MNSPKTALAATQGQSTNGVSVAAHDLSFTTMALPTFDVLYDEHIDFVCRSIRRMGIASQDVEDVAQKTFVIAHRRLHEFEGRSSAKTWLFAILYRVASEHRRSQRRKSPGWFGRWSAVQPDELESPKPAHDPFEQTSRKQAAEVIREILATLDEDKRAMFILSELEGLAPADIAEAMGLERTTVYAKLRAARDEFEQQASLFRRRSERNGR